MKQLVKKRIAVLLTISMAVSMSVPSYATPPTSESDTVNVTIENNPGGYITASFIEGEYTYYIPIGETVSIPKNAKLSVDTHPIDTTTYDSDCILMTLNGIPATKKTNGNWNYTGTLDEDTVISATFKGNEKDLTPPKWSAGNLKYENGSTDFYSLSLEPDANIPLYVINEKGELVKYEGNTDITAVYFSHENGKSKKIANNSFSIENGSLHILQPLEDGNYRILCKVANGNSNLSSSVLNLYYGYNTSVNFIFARTEVGSRAVGGSIYYGYDRNGILADYANQKFKTRLVGYDFTGFENGSRDIGSLLVKDAFSSSSNYVTVWAKFKNYEPPYIESLTDINENKSGWVQSETGDWSYYDEQGVLVRNAFVTATDTSSRVYYVDDSGKMVTNGIYTFESDSKVGAYGKSAAKKLAEKINAAEKPASVFIESDGSLSSGMIKYNGNLLYVDPNYGTLVHNEIVKYYSDFYYFGDDFKAVNSGLTSVTNDYTGKTDLYYFGEDCKALLLTWKFVDSDDGMQLYYFGRDGEAAKGGNKNYSGRTYSFDSDGTAHPTLTDKERETIASPSQAKNAATLSKKALEDSIKLNTTAISETKYDSQDKAEGYLDRLVDFILAPFQLEAGNLDVSDGKVTYIAPVSGNEDTTAGTDGSISKEYILTQSTDAEDYTATASVAVKITAASEDETVKPDPDKPNPEQPNPDKPNPEQPNPDKPSTPSTPNKGNSGSSTIGSSGGSRSSSSWKPSVVRTSLPETSGSWKQNEHGQWQFLNPNGTIYRDTWIVYNGQWYYINAEGIMLITWQFINGKWYYFTVNSSDGHPSGSLLVSATTPDGYKVDANGAWIQ